MNSWETSFGDHVAGGAKGSELLPVLNVLLLYEDLATGLRARRTFEGAVHGLEFQADFNLDLARFDMLCPGDPVSGCSGVAAEQDIVLVSAHGSKHLPPSLCAWIEGWTLQRKGGDPSALILSLDETARDTGTAGRVTDWLQSVAQSTGVDLFQHFGQSAPMEADLTRDLHQRAITRTALLDGILNRPERYANWGINE